MRNTHSTGTVSFRCFNGMTIPLESSDDRDDLRAEVARYLARERAKGAEISTLAKGAEWEVISASDAAGIAVGDDSGVLVLRLPVFPECWDCGYPVAPGESCGCQEGE